MTTVADAIARTRRHIYTETRDELNRLTTTINASVTSLTFDFDLAGIATGAILSIDLEEIHVWTSGGSVATVERGVNGTTAAAHSAGATVRVNAKITDFDVLRCLNDDLIDLSGHGLFQVATTTVTYDPAYGAYVLNLGDDLIDIIEVSYDANDGTRRWNTLRQGQWRLARNLPNDVFNGGVAITINGYASPGQRVNITYKAPFSANLSALTDTLSQSGLPSTCEDLPPLGAAIRLTAGAEVARNFLDQGETRRAGELPPGARLGEARGLIMLRQARIQAEAARLYAQYPAVA